MQHKTLSIPFIIYSCGASLFAADLNNLSTAEPPVPDEDTPCLFSTLPAEMVEDVLEKAVLPPGIRKDAPIEEVAGYIRKVSLRCRLVNKQWAAIVSPKRIYWWLCKQGVSREQLGALRNSVHSPTVMGGSWLHGAIQCDTQERTLDMLASYPAEDIHEQDCWGNSTVHTAVIYCKPALVAPLLACKVRVDAQDEQGCTPLVCAARKGLHDVAQVLLEHGADVNYRPDGLPSVLETAICKDAGRGEAEGTVIPITSFNKVVLLLCKARGAQVNAADPLTGNTPLLRAVMKENTAVTNHLLNAGALVATANNEGVTPLSYADEQGLYKIAHSLRRAVEQQSKAVELHEVKGSNA